MSEKKNMQIHKNPSSSYYLLASFEQFSETLDFIINYYCYRCMCVPHTNQYLLYIHIYKVFPKNSKKIKNSQ